LKPIATKEQEMKKLQQPPQPSAQIQGLVTDGKFVVSKDGRYVTVYFADGSKIREHRNRFLSILGAEFTPEAQKALGDEPKTLTTGFIARTRISLTKDGNYVMVFFPGGRFVKHVNYLKSILGIAFEPVAKARA